MNDEVQNTRRQILWGLVVIGIGAIFLMERTDLLRFSQFWHYWPAIIAVFGVAKMIPPTTSRHVLDGLCQVLVAGWLYVSVEHVWGLSFHNSWPILVIIGGIGMLLKPIVIKYSANQEEK